MGQDYVPPHDIFGPIGLLWAKWLLLASLLLVLAWLWWRFVKKRARKEVEPTAANAPYEELWRRFEALSPTERFDETECLSFYQNLSEIVRLALATSLGAQVIAATTLELKRFLMRQSPLSVDDTQRLLRFLETADGVKFARQNASQMDALSAKQEVGRWLAKIAPPREARQ